MQSGDQKTARQILKGMLVQDETNQSAWIYYAKTFSSPRDQEAALRKALERRQLVESNRLLQDSLAARTPGFLGESPPIRRAIEIARKAAAANSTVLLLGESGTGKEVFAHAIHRRIVSAPAAAWMLGTRPRVEGCQFQEVRHTGVSGQREHVE